MNVRGDIPVRRAHVCLAVAVVAQSWIWRARVRRDCAMDPMLLDALAVLRVVALHDCGAPLALVLKDFRHSSLVVEVTGADGR